MGASWELKATWGNSFKWEFELFELVSGLFAEVSESDISSCLAACSGSATCYAFAWVELSTCAPGLSSSLFTSVCHILIHIGNRKLKLRRRKALKKPSKPSVSGTQYAKICHHTFGQQVISEMSSCQVLYTSVGTAISDLSSVACTLASGTMLDEFCS